MKEYENKTNPFTLSFGNEPFESVSREPEKSEIIANIERNPPLSHCFIITGARGSGKTVMLTSVAQDFRKSDEWIVIELNPEDDMREGLAAKLYSNGGLKKLFLEKKFSFSFKGISFSLTGKNPILNIDDLLIKMFEAIAKEKKKVLVVVDEISNNSYAKKFALSFQILIRNDYPLFLLATSLYENISSLKREKNLTFLIRAPKVFLQPLNILAVKESYEDTLGVSSEVALECAKVTKGYAFAFQLLGFLMFEEKKKKIDVSLLREFDRYLAEYSYNKIWSLLSPIEINILKSIGTNSTIRVSEILQRNKIDKSYFSQYRDRLIKKGILVSPRNGYLVFALPRFKEFIDTKTINYY